MDEVKKKKTALITGGSSGIGAAFANVLARKNYNLILTGRQKDRLESLQEDLQQGLGAHVEMHLLDFYSEEEFLPFVEEMKHRSIQLLINNAGFGLWAPFTEEPFERWQTLMHVHMEAPLRLIHALLPGMKREGEGAIINVSSLNTFFPMARSATYAGSKGFLKVYSQALQAELKDSPIKVQALCPGLTRTRFHNTMGISVREKNRGLMRWKSPYEVVNRSLKDLERGRVVSIPGWLERQSVLLGALLPQKWFMKIMASLRLD